MEVKRIKGFFPERRAACQNVERARQIDLKIKTRISHGSRHRYLRGKMINLIRVGHGLLHQPRIAHVAHCNLQPSSDARRLSQPFQIMVHARAREIIKDMHLGICAGKQRVGQV